MHRPGIHTQGASGASGSAAHSTRRRPASSCRAGKAAAQHPCIRCDKIASPVMACSRQAARLARPRPPPPAGARCDGPAGGRRPGPPAPQTGACGLQTAAAALPRTWHGSHLRCMEKKGKTWKRRPSRAAQAWLGCISGACPRPLLRANSQRIKLARALIPCACKRGRASVGRRHGGGQRVATPSAAAASACEPAAAAPAAALQACHAACRTSMHAPASSVQALQATCGFLLTLKLLDLNGCPHHNIQRHREGQEPNGQQEAAAKVQRQREAARGRVGAQGGSVGAGPAQQEGCRRSRPAGLPPATRLTRHLHAQWTESGTPALQLCLQNGKDNSSNPHPASCVRRRCILRRRESDGSSLAVLQRRHRGGQQLGMDHGW